MNRTAPGAVVALSLVVVSCESQSGGGGAGSGAASSVTADATIATQAATGTGTQASSGGGPVCGDGTCDPGEACETCESDCGACMPIPCPHDGGLFCGGNGVGGDPEKLYVCTDGFLEVEQDCGGACQYMPLGIPDQCPAMIDVPASLIDTIDSTPYVEQDCRPATYPGWPYSAEECTYTADGQTATVVVANPSADRVGRWIVDSATYIPALAALRDTDPGAYEDGLSAIGLAMLYQSSRIFPLTGIIIEPPSICTNGRCPFDDGVSNPCSSGCYCRINSLHRTEWCAYQAGLGMSEDACFAAVGTSGHTEGWAAQCLQNHADSWTSDANEHFRARAYAVNQTVAAACPPNQCSPSEVIAVLESALGL